MTIDKQKLELLSALAAAIHGKGTTVEMLNRWAQFEAACKPALIQAMVAEINQLKAENEALRKDAERYQWLRQGMGKVIVVEPDNDAPCECDGYEVLLESEVDDAVDADIAKEAIHD